MLPFTYDAALEPTTSRFVGEGLNVGKDPAGPVTADYPSANPYRFTGGAIKEAITDASPQHYVNLEVEALGLTKRD